MDLQNETWIDGERQKNVKWKNGDSGDNPPPQSNVAKNNSGNCYCYGNHLWSSWIPNLWKLALQMWPKHRYCPRHYRCLWQMRQRHLRFRSMCHFHFPPHYSWCDVAVGDPRRLILLECQSNKKKGRKWKIKMDII